MDVRAFTQDVQERGWGATTTRQWGDDGSVYVCLCGGDCHWVIGCDCGCERWFDISCAGVDPEAPLPDVWTSPKCHPLA